MAMDRAVVLLLAFRMGDVVESRPVS